MNDLASVPDGVDLSNWRTSPSSQWAFQNVRHLIPCVPVSRGTEAALLLTSEPQCFREFQLSIKGHAPLTLHQFLEATSTDALVILRHGKIIHEFYAHGMTAGTLHIVMSASKSVVGLIAGMLSDSGQLDLDAPFCELVPEIAATAYRGASLRHLLDMRSGVVLDVEAMTDYLAAANWDPFNPKTQGANLHSFFAKLSVPASPHGGPFRYMSANTDLLGWALERASHRSFASLVSELLWQPMGAAGDARITVDRQGSPRCTGGMSMTARDFARIGQLMAQGGTRDGRHIIPAAVLTDIASNGDPTAWRQGEFAAGFPGMNINYRSGWYVVDDEPRTLFAMGIHGQNLFVDLRQGIVIAKLSSQRASIDNRALGLTHQAVPQITRCITDSE